jgi:hypothetical protein
MDEAKAHVAARDAQLKALETEVSRLASSSATPVLLAMLRVLVDTVCAAQGETFTTIYKIKFYENVLRTLRVNGIS